jgi:membrane protease YdiL (CAAX protease family)
MTSVHPPSTFLMKPNIMVVWIVTLFVSTLPTIIWREISGQVPEWLFWTQLALLGIMIGLSLVWKEIRGLRQYFIVIFVLYLCQWAFGRIGETALWKSWFGTPSFSTSILGTQLLRLGVALVMVLFMRVLKQRWSDFFLVRGMTDAPVSPIRWLGVKAGVRWNKFGLILSICISLGTLVFLVIFGRPSLNALIQVVPLIPVVLLFAVMNSFSEEMSYRASELAVLKGVVSNQQALLLTAVFFGIGHYYGVPYGVIGVVMAGLLGWLLGKSMLETKGFLWAWLIHFLQDVLIFLFMAIGSIVAGG